MEECIFCQIVQKKIPSFVVYEDEDMLGFLDINPLAPGHTLLIPKKHYETIFDLPDEISDKVLKVARAISESMKNIGATGVNMVNASGKEAGQAVPHYHLHIIPRSEGDGVTLYDWWHTQVKKVEPNILKEIQGRIKTNKLEREEPVNEVVEEKPKEKKRKKQETYFIRREVEKT